MLFEIKLFNMHFERKLRSNKMEAEGRKLQFFVDCPSDYSTATSAALIWTSINEQNLSVFTTGSWLKANKN